MSQHDPNFRPGLDSQGFPLKPKKSHAVRNIFIALAGTFVLMGGCTAIVASSGTDVAKEAAKPSVVKTTTAPKPAAPSTTEPVAPATTEPEVTEDPKPSMTKSQEQAIGSAESYLELTAFSRKGLIRQLSSDAVGFSKADATFAVNHIKVDWNEQAAKAAKSYLDLTHFSRAGLIQQLTSSAVGFTHAQAVYGVNKAGL